MELIDGSWLPRIQGVQLLENGCPVSGSDYPHTVAVDVVEGSVIIGCHVPREILAVCSFFLQCTGTTSLCEVYNWSQVAW